MLNFSTFLSESKIKTMNAKEGDDDGDRHFRKYVNLGSKVTFARDHEGVAAGTDAEVVDKKTINGVHHAIVKVGKKTIQAPINKLVKPAGAANKGLKFEEEFVRNLVSHGVMKPGSSGAGFTAGNDFHIYNRRTQTVHDGKVSEDFEGESSPPTSDPQGEAKESLKADFGQLTLSHDPNKGGWHISDKARGNRGEYASQIENATITVNGKQKRLLDHINETIPPPTKGKVTKANLYSDDTDLSPMHAYLRDHHVDVLHIGSHGTFRAGLSEKKDRTGTDLPVATGTGKFRVRGKHKTGNLMIAFNPTSMEKSNLDIHKNPEHMEEFKRRIGVGMENQTQAAHAPAPQAPKPSRGATKPGAFAVQKSADGNWINNQPHSQTLASSEHGGMQFHTPTEQADHLRGFN